MKISQFLLMLTIPLTTSVMAVERSPSTDNATAYIISPVNGETVSNPVTVIFGLKNMGVAPAGIKKPHTGHHHLLINAGQIPKINQPIPSQSGGAVGGLCGSS